MHSKYLWIHQKSLKVTPALPCNENEINLPRGEQALGRCTIGCEECSQALPDRFRMPVRHGTASAAIRQTKNAVILGSGVPPWRVVMDMYIYCIYIYIFIIAVHSCFKAIYI